jgi:hypothetical protein
MGDYVPRAPIDDEAKRHNENLPGMGGVFNYVNLHVYHYAGNNPVKLMDPDGKFVINNVAANTKSARDFASQPNQVDSIHFRFGSAYVFTPGQHVDNPSITGSRIVPMPFFRSFIILPGGLNTAIDKALNLRNDGNVNTSGEITVSAEKMKDSNIYEIKVSVYIDDGKNGKQRIADNMTIAFAGETEVLKDGKRDQGRINAIANETINIIRNTPSYTQNIGD